MAPKPTPISVTDKAAVLKATAKFNMRRAEAINAFADFERSLGLLFETLLGAQSRKAWAAFHGIRTNRDRVTVLGKLLTIEHGDKYEAFFSSFSTQIEGIDGTRNKIVHWIALQAKKKDEFLDICLHQHPDLYSEGRLREYDIVHFIHKMDFYRLLIYYFRTFLTVGDQIDFTDLTPWREIFQQPILYPPAKNHPLSRPRKTP